ncbi:SANT/Myb_domain [Hexamita inflata]|uniref:SANT/Myb domain n=1 Tax=Hexamita inflata TaxID=28002 RepID=A0AA86V954_9EUKA|nr:SANT/Myb domain [Hexamita inflata]
MSARIRMWTESECTLFKHLYSRFGKDFRLISEHFKDRSYTQVRSHYYNIMAKKQDSRKPQQTQMETLKYIVFDAIEPLD